MKTEQRPATWRERLTVLPSRCDAELRLTAHAAAAVCQDVATLHAEALHAGIRDLREKNRAFWALRRMRLKFFRMPSATDGILVETWPLPPDGLRVERCFRIGRGGETCVSGRSEWIIMDAGTRRPVRLKDTCYPADLVCREDRGPEGPYGRLRDDFTEEEMTETRPVRATDTDSARHMNNVAYVRFLTDTFPSGFWRDRRPDTLDLHFLRECPEGEPLSVFRRSRDGVFSFAFRGAAGKTVFLAALSVRPRTD